ncbi:transglutaminase [Rubrivivax gelatinosus]|uniref:Transglutaminase n=1 Tax=Rubrivivax gelatinosus TaxID=28068 RepID=A0ABS1E2Q4_RUBGE|nr:transglutaminase [Rubrivivax gelatinosus]MBK1715745.1 transglutaminase [Rubrivivax gelatinosus]
MPREARDTLFLLAVIAWTLAPHLAQVPAWCGAMAALILGWRAWLALTSRPLPGRLVLVALLVAAGALTFWSERTLLGKDAGVTLIVVLMTLKTLELRARRDALVVFFLGFFLVLTNFLYSQSLPVALSMLLSVWGLLTALVLAHMPVGRPPLRQAGALAARAALLGAPIMVVLFLLFPRVGPLWGLPQDAAGRTGLSGTMRLGAIAEVANDDSIALRLRFPDGAAPPPEAMYLRGPVLGRFDGRTWERVPENLGGATRVELLGAPVRYEMTLEPSRLPLLPLLELTPARADAAPVLEGWNVRLRQDLQWQLDRPLTDRVRLSATAWPGHRIGPRATPPLVAENLELPPGFNPRTLAWARALRARPEYSGADAGVLAAALLREVGAGGYGYTLEPGPYGRDAIDEFWLDRKLGFCEHFAAAFVVAMRAMGVPARIVTGYQGTDPAPVDGWWIVRQSNAHAWAEYWQRGVGWVRADPTAAVAPERVQRGRSLAPQPGFVAGAIGNVDPALAARLRTAWELLDNRWNQLVLNYSRTRQFELLRALGVESPDWEDLARALVLLAAAASAAGAGWAFWDRHRQDPWQRLQARVQRALAARGVEVGPQHGPRARAERVRARLGGRGEALALELETLDRLRYGEGVAAPSRRWWPGFARALRAAGRP